MANSDDENRDSFIRERVVVNRRSKKEVFWGAVSKILFAILLAVVFGAVSGLVFAKVSHTLSENNKPVNEQEHLSIPRDEDNTDEITTEVTTEITTEVTTESETVEKLEDTVKNSINGTDIKLDINDYADMYASLSDSMTKVNKAVVTISSKKETLDWFNNSVENSDVCSGVIWNITDTEILIAAICEFSENTPMMVVEFCDGTYADAYVKGYDLSTKLAVISVLTENVSSEIYEDIGVVKLGNSYLVSEGDPIAVAGNPSGYIGSVLYGHISYMIDNMLVADMSQKGLLTDVHTYAGGNGFVVNHEGELLGLYGADCSGEFTKAYGISDLKGVLEKLSNGESVAYLGIIGRGITADMAKKHNLVQGIYVIETVVDEAAYSAGIMSGDIIVAVDGNKVFTLRSLQNAIETSSVGDEVSITVMRTGAEEYTELVFEFVLGSR